MNGEPKRLLESGELSPEQRALLETARTHPPVHYDVASGAARFRSALDALPAASTATALSPITATVKLGLVLAVSAGLVATYYAQNRTPNTESKPSTASDVAPPPSARPAEAPSVPHDDSPASAAPSEEHLAVEDQDRTVHTRRARKTVQRGGANARASAAKVAPQAVSPEPVATPAQPEPPPAQAPSPPVEQLDELRSIARARLLVTRDPRAALDLLHRIARVHPRGFLVEEREALRVFALAADGQSDAAERRAEAFLKAYPNSPFADRVRAAGLP